jgi:hypothetical protein
VFASPAIFNALAMLRANRHLGQPSRSRMRPAGGGDFTANTVPRCWKTRRGWWGIPFPAGTPDQQKLILTNIPIRPNRRAGTIVITGARRRSRHDQTSADYKIADGAMGEWGAGTILRRQGPSRSATATSRPMLTARPTIVPAQMPANLNAGVGDSCPKDRADYALLCVQTGAGCPPVSWVAHRCGPVLCRPQCFFWSGVRFR